MKKIKFKKRKEHEKFSDSMEKNGLIVGDFVFLITEKGSYVDVTVTECGGTVEGPYVGEVSYIEEEEGLDVHFGSLVEFNFSNVHKVSLRV